MKTLNEASGKIFMGKNLKAEYDESLLLENQIKKREEEKAAKEATDMLLQLEKQKQEEILSKIDKLEMLPPGRSMIVLPYPSNPYKRTISEGGILIDYDGSFLNPDTGEQDKATLGIACAKIIEVGPECKIGKPGDDVYFDTRTSYPLPFMHLGYRVINEPSALAFIGEGLKERVGYGRD